MARGARVAGTRTRPRDNPGSCRLESAVERVCARLIVPRASRRTCRRGAHAHFLSVLVRRARGWVRRAVRAPRVQVRVEPRPHGDCSTTAQSCGDGVLQSRLSLLYSCAHVFSLCAPRTPGSLADWLLSCAMLSRCCSIAALPQCWSVAALQRAQGEYVLKQGSGLCDRCSYHV